MVPLFKKNTLEQTGFMLTKNGFVHRGINYSFEEVIQTSSIRQVFETRVVGVGSEYAHSIGILFVMVSGENVQITEQPTWFSTSTLKRVEQIQSIFNFVSEQTFHNRANKYLKQFELQGYFEYSGWIFYPEKMKMVLKEKKLAYSVQTTKFLRNYGYIKVLNESDSIGDKIRNKFKSDVVINTLIDTDVFFALLKKFFYLEWK